MEPKYKVGDCLFYQDQWGIMLIYVKDINILRQKYETLVSRNNMDTINVPYSFNLLHSDRIRLATKAERILLCPLK